MSHSWRPTGAVRPRPGLEKCVPRRVYIRCHPRVGSSGGSWQGRQTGSGRLKDEGQRPARPRRTVIVHTSFAMRYAPWVLRASVVLLCCLSFSYARVSMSGLHVSGNTIQNSDNIGVLIHVRVLATADLVRSSRFSSIQILRSISFGCSRRRRAPTILGQNMLASKVRILE